MQEVTDVLMDVPLDIKTYVVNILFNTNTTVYTRDLSLSNASNIATKYMYISTLYTWFLYGK